MCIANVVVDFFVKGGPIMWPILLCFIASLVVLVERALWWGCLSKRYEEERLNVVFTALTMGEFATVVAETDDPSDPFLNTIHKGVTHAHLSLLGAMQLQASDEIEKADKRLWILATFITLAPLLGLLGTVLGIKDTFDVLGDAELSAVKVTGGIGEALVATSCGLGIAILCLLPYNYFTRRLAHFRARLERTINHVELLTEFARHHGHDIEEFARRLPANKTATALAESCLRQTESPEKSPVQHHGTI
ncbi:MAG: MotA/TolQ/ExbB proton channel family protein [Puniceicoccales bacterium]|jgi:biopolymer transport protein ExbB|nr:MotA/TolQ/ExbB proton channel family protein [Puniceicoccales bacterium]